MVVLMDMSLIETMDAVSGVKLDAMMAAKQVERMDA